MILRHEELNLSGALIKEYKTIKDIDPELINFFTKASSDFSMKNKILEDIKSLLRRKKILYLVSVGFNERQVWENKRCVKESLVN